MKPFIHPSFWSDPEIEAQSHETKLVALWMITNSQTSVLGICEASTRRFSFETGLPPEALESAVEALPKMFQRVGRAVFIRNYIRHQFGSGESLQRNNFFKQLTSVFLGQIDEIKSSILNEYPEFSEALPEGLQRASQAQGKVRIGKDRIGKGNARDSEAPSTHPVPENLSAIPGFAEEFSGFVAHRKKLKKPMTDHAKALLLEKLATRPADAIAALRMSIENGWQGVEWDWFDKRGGGAKSKTLPLRAGEEPPVWDPGTEEAA